MEPDKLVGKHKKQKRLILDSSDESDEDAELLQPAADTTVDETNHNTLIQSLKSSIKTKRKRFGKDEDEQDILDASGKLVLKPIAGESTQDFLDLFDESDKDLLKQVKSAITTSKPKKKKVKGEAIIDATSLTTSLEKPAAQRIQREILYNNANKEVSKWNAIVYNNRVADQLIFPVPEEKKLSKKDARNNAEDTFVPMTPLEIEMAKLIHGEGYVEQQKEKMLGKKEVVDDGETYVRTVEEALERHHELARLRAIQSYEMAKAKRQGKIKSKKYHRLQRREKIRKQMKEFEELQKTDPEAALLKLEELDRARIQERMSLKHRNTSKWAKAQTVRAKYNRESRAELAEQLKISRELTRKVAESSDESDPDDVDLELPALVKSSLDNPWCLTGSLKDNDKVNMYYTGYKKFWDDVNERKERERKRVEREEARQLEEKEKAKKRREEEKKKTEELSDEDDVLEKVPVAAPPKKKKKKGKKKAEIIQETPLVSAKDVPQEMSVDDLDELLHLANQKLKQKLTKEVKRLKGKKEASLSAQTQVETERRKPRIQDGDIDEIRDLALDDSELNFERNDPDEPQNLNPAPVPVPFTENKEQLNVNTDRPPQPQQIIDPSHFLEIRKSSKFDMKNTNVDFDSDNELLSEDEDEDDEREHVKMIAEAFEDEDLLNDFERRKGEEIEAGKPKDVNLTLPGWGEWGGKDRKPSKRKQQRFTKKLPKQRPRKDATLPHVILNDNANAKLREHQVKSLPFPFTRVADYEKMVRAPIGRTWLPEKAMKDLIAPKVITRLGQAIAPINDEVIFKTSAKKKAAKTLKLIK